MDLIVDIGNSYTKLAVFDGDALVKSFQTDQFQQNDLEALIHSGLAPSASIISSVKNYPAELMESLGRFGPCLLLDHHTPLPFTKLYKTPDTLGNDRLAVMAAAGSIFPSEDVLVIDAGTCITYDLLNKHNEYLGGGISPGIRIRYQSLHTFTGRLPLIQSTMESIPELIGQTTADCMHSGIMHGVIAEVDGIINSYRQQFPALKIIVGGGDYKYFDKYLKNNIFALPNIVLVGLKKILDFNEGQQG